MRTPAQQWLQQHGLTALIATLIVGSLGMIAYETQWGTNLRPLPSLVYAQAAKNADTSLMPAFVVPAMETGFREFVDRPLFISTRRPVPLVNAPGQSAMKKGQFRLAGTVVNQDLPYAFLVDVSTGKGMRVAKGAEIFSSGISVASVESTRVILKQGEESEELMLRTAPPPSAAISPMTGVVRSGMPQAPAPTGAVMSGVPPMPVGTSAGPVPGGPAATMVLPGSSALPGFVQGPPGALPNATPANAADGATGNPRRRRFPNVPPQ
jgi:hypothetical protein